MPQVLLVSILALLPAAAALSAGPALRVARRPASMQRTVLLTMAEEEELSFDFTSGGTTVSPETEDALASEEPELTERQKEIERLRAAEKFMLVDTGDATCRTCGYKYTMEGGDRRLPPKTPFEIVPDSWTCPSCNSPKAFFDPVQQEIAGFAENQQYGFGGNSMSEAAKSNLIFGGIGFFFILLLSGYALN